MYLFIDTETTGFKKSGSMMQDGQARMCQVAAILTDEKAVVRQQFSTLIKPEGWTISDGAFNVHGISDVDCYMYGMKQSDAIETIGRMAKFADTVVAHNAAFDKAIMEIELAYFGAEDPYLDDWYCTMITNTHINNGKWPKLEQALTHYTGKTLGAKAHDAMADAIGCMEVFFAMKK